ncbi:MAG: hypothetical protein RL380_814 [Verrucomicrobiota bacterium]|jgi:endonuclease/exonuclease/phosphatase family metal-dependent hydrolase
MHRSPVSSLVHAWLSLTLLFAAHTFAQTTVNVRLMAANLNGNVQSISAEAINIYKGLKPDVVCIQEFNYNNNTAADFRALLDDAFGTNFVYYRETTSLQIPNGIISRYPILASGRWQDTEVSNRGFAWARLDLPGTNDLYAVSVHLKAGSSDASIRTTQANNLKALILSNFPANAWIVIGGDFNAYSRTEAAITTLATVCVDKPIPTDAESGGDNDTNNGRSNPYDYVLISAPMTNYLTNVVFATHSFSNGLVFDSRVYTPLSDVSPVVSSDSSLAQHMAVLKDFAVPTSGSNAPTAPTISAPPQSLTIAVGATANFTVTATGTAPLTYRWRFNGTNISGATTNTYALANAQTTNNGSYTVVITNSAGSVTSSVATLTVSNTAPSIATNPVALAIYTGETAAFSVVANGTAPLAYQWRFNGTNLSGATNDDYSFNNAQLTNAGNYTVIVTNAIGSVTSAVAALTVSNAAPAVTTQPVSASVNVGDSANFFVAASGTSPLDFQWRFNGTNLVGANATNYSLANLQLTNAGNYTVVITNLAGSVTSSVAVLSVSTNTVGILAQWNFNSNPADASTTTGTTNPSVGSGTASVVGGLTPVTQYFGGGGADPAASADNSAWTPGGYPAASVGNKTAGVKFAVSTVGKQNISVSWSSQASGSASKYARLQYTTNGTDFVDFTAPVTNATSFSTRTNSLNAITAVNNNANFAVRLVTEFESTAIGSATASYVGASSTYGSAGNLRYDMVTISGSNLTTSNSPAATPQLTAPTFTNNQFAFTVTGTATTNYAVQASTNLAVTNWTSLVTNPAPFTYTQSNATSFPLRFFRAVLP